jgi:23S rRNA pseudouridine2605 synthase
MERLSKVLAAAGIASRRACEQIIFDGRVRVNGSVIRLPQHHVDVKKDRIAVDGKGIGKTQRKLYYALNKPRGYLCTARPGRDERIVLDLFPGISERLFTVGRLDRDTSGLIIVTNDGHFSNDVIHPRNNVEKEYLVKVSQEVEAHHLAAITKGAWVEGVYCRPVRVKKVRRGTIKVVVKEGKKREVRQLVAHAQLNLLELRRIRIGGLVLGTLPEGTFRPLEDYELELLKQSA